MNSLETPKERVERMRRELAETGKPPPLIRGFADDVLYLVRWLTQRGMGR